MAYTNKNTSNTIEDKNTIKSRTNFHCGPQHKTSGQDKTVTECVILNKMLLLKKKRKRNRLRTEMRRESNCYTHTEKRRHESVYRYTPN